MKLNILPVYFREVIRSMKAQPLRSGITLVIIAIGILALVGTLTVVDALQNTFTGNLKAIGANSFTIQRYENSLLQGRRRHGRGWLKKNNPPVTRFEARMFKEKFKFPQTIVSLGFTALSSAELTRGTKKTSQSVELIAVDENYARVNQFQIKSGRNFTKQEITSGANRVIIGPQVANALFGREDPVGKAIFYKGNKLYVIGVTKEKGTGLGSSQDNFVWVPYHLAFRLVNFKSRIPFRIRVLVEDPIRYDQALVQAKLLMRSIRKLRPGQPDNFGISGSKEALEELKQIDRVLRIAAFIIGLITIFASSIALMNIMLVTVTEKLREIGIRKAVGASNKDILFQFLMETLIIAFMGSLVGIVLGILMGWGVAALLHIKFTMPWTAVFWAVFITFIAALASGLYPAVKASRANPIEVLRYE